MLTDLFARDYAGGDFVLFGATHLIALGVVAAVCLAIALLRRCFTPRARVITRWVLLAIIYLSEGSWQVWMLATGQWTPQVMLPLWLCSVTSWTMPLLLVWRSQRYYDWAYFMGLLGAALALLTPDLMNYGFPHFRFIEFFLLHGTLIAAVIYMTVVEGFRPSRRALPRVFVWFNLLFAFDWLVNSLLGSNYLYTQTKLPTPSPLDLLGPRPWYLLWMELLGILVCLLLYLPFLKKPGDDP